MEFPVLLLATRAEVRDGLLDVTGGGWEHYTCPELPGTVVGTLCGLVRTAPNERRRPHLLTFGVRTEDGRPLTWSGSLALPAGEGPGRQAFAVPVALAVVEATPVVFEIRDDEGTLMAYLPLVIRVQET